MVAEHRGYSRLPNAVIHKRTINLDKKNRCWLIDDEFVGEAENKIAIRFHFDAGLEMTSRENLVSARDLISGSSLIVCAVTLKSEPLLEVQATSRDYGEQQPSITACWNVTGRHSKLQWLIVPVCSRESEAERLQVCKVSVRVSSQDRLLSIIHI